MSNHIISTCPQCGADIPFGSLYCNYCGHKIELSNNASGQDDKFYVAFQAAYVHTARWANKFINEIETSSNLGFIQLYMRYSAEKIVCTHLVSYNVISTQVNPLLKSEEGEEFILYMRGKFSHCFIEDSEMMQLNELGVDTSQFAFTTYEGCRSVRINVTKDKYDYIKQVIATLSAMQIANKISNKGLCFTQAGMDTSIYKMTLQEYMADEKQRVEEAKKQESANSGCGEGFWGAIIVFVIIIICSVYYSSL